MKRFLTFLLALTMFPVLPSHGKSRKSDGPLVLRRVFSYAATVDTVGWGGTVSYSYMKYGIETRRRNFLLLAVPTMFAVAHSGQRQHVGEGYDRLTVRGDGRLESHRLLERTTVPNRMRTMPTILKYLTPYFYGETLIGGEILSPFFRRNRRYYRYRISSPDDSTAVIRFRPRLDNTQLVRGTAVADLSTGRLRRVTIEGEYDMVRFRTDAVMGRSGVRSLMPDSCHLNGRFKLLGNNITSEYMAVYGLPEVLGDTVPDRRDTTMMARVRPFSLSGRDSMLFARMQTPADTTAGGQPLRKRKSWFGNIGTSVWQNVGQQLLTRMRSRFGSRDQGYFRIDPILNPLYFGYSKRKGLTYKLDIRGRYYFSPNLMASARLKGGYSFKQKRFYFQLPLKFYFDVRHNGYLQCEIGNGNQIYNSSVLDDIKTQNADSINWDGMFMTYFNDFNLRFSVNYDFSPVMGVNLGIVSHRRTAIYKDGFLIARRPTSYVSSAPTVELTVRPWGFDGPVFTADYERSFRGLLDANIEYERYELDGQYTLKLSKIELLQMRLGTGFYTHKGKGWYFLDYTNFHDNNIPGGWNDDWACDFELLDSRWYNSSKYYVRANVTYEAPLLVLSRLPWVGRFVEKERIYLNALNVTRLHPYIEYGYGFSTRLFSLGMFVAQRNGRYDGFGVRIGLELFSRW